MAFGIIAGTPVTSASTADDTSFTIDLPSGIVAGELLQIHVVLDNITTSNIAGWSASGGVTDGSTIRSVRWQKVADGTEGSSVTMTTGVATGFAAIAIRISGWTGDTVNGVAQATSTSSSSSPGVVSLGPVGWGADDNLFFTILAWDNGNTISLTGNPGGYTLYRTNIRSTHVGGVGIAIAGAESTADTSPATGTWVLSGSSVFVSRTVAIQPGAEPSFNGGYNVKYAKYGNKKVRPRRRNVGTFLWANELTIPEPLPDAKCRIYCFELEVINGPTKARIAGFELETPDGPPPPPGQLNYWPGYSAPWLR